MPTAKRNLRFALVRNVSTYFYLAPPQSPLTTQLTSSIHNHIGPLRLWRDYETDLFTVKDGSWLQLIGLEAFFLGSASDKNLLLRLAETRKWAVPSTAVDWNQYDFVLCIDSTVPASIIRKHKKPVWAIFCSSPCPSLYALKRWRPLFGYSTVLIDSVADSIGNKFQQEKLSTDLRCFPLSFFRSNDLLDFDGVSHNERVFRLAKSGVHVEKHCSELLTPSEINQLRAFGPVSFCVSRSDYIPTMTARKYFVITSENIRYLKGHSIIEANGFGCLVLVKQGVRLAMANLVADCMRFKSFDELVTLLETLESDFSAYRAALQRQQAHIDKYVYERPKMMLESLVRHHAANREVGLGIYALVRDSTLSWLYPLLWILLIPAYRAAYLISKHALGRDLACLLSNLFHKRQ